MPRQTAVALGRAGGLAVICHELRNPATVVAGAIDLLAGTPLDAGQRDCLALMKSASESLLRLVNDTLDLARLGAPCQASEPVSFSLRQSLRQTLRMTALEARGKGVPIACAIAPAVPDLVLGDPLRLRQVLLNLLGNALKFTERGQITVRVACEAEARDTVICRFAVTDSGPGIPEAQQAAIFEPFVQAGAGGGPPGGLGLGLHVAARLVAAMHGRIWVDSRPGQGSTFTFTARFGVPPQPARQAVAGRRPHAPVAPQPGEAPARSVLLVDDDPLCRHLAELALARAGWAVRTAGSAAEALAALDAGDAEPPDLIVLDLHMPGGDGRQLARTLRARESGGAPRIPLVGLTADTRPHARHGCRRAGMDACLSKPVDPARLRQLLDILRAPALDLAALEERVGHSRVLLREIVALFAQHGTPLLRAVRAACDAGDLAAAAGPLHRLAGMYRNLAAPAAVAAAQALEAALLAKAGAPGLAARLEREHDRLGRALAGADAAPPPPGRPPAIAAARPARPRACCLYQVAI